MAVKSLTRRWWKPRFSLRSLLVAMLLLGCGLGWLTTEMRRAQRQQEAVARIRSLGGHAHYADQLDSAGEFRVAKHPSRPRFVTSLFGDDFLRQVHRVSLHAPLAANAELESLRQLPHVKDLRISSQHITDEEVRHLRGLEHLEHLDLRCNQVTDQGLQHLRGLTSLTELSLYRTQVTDAGQIHLHGLKNLRVLKVRGTRVTSQGAASLQKLLPNCEVLGVEASDSDEGL